MSGKSNNQYELKLTNGLPPGCDSWEQFTSNPRQPRPPATPKRPVPQWPPREERKGKWIKKYLDQLDPQTEYDQIIRTVVFFGPSAFAAALSYTAIFAILTQPPAGAAAIHHGGKVVRRGHQRFYETQLQEFDWAWHGSGAPETAARIEQVNRIHAGIWKRVPGAYSAPFEGQMAIIGAAYFETLVRRSVGARNDVDPKVKAAWAEWCERVVAHFRTEPSDGGRSYGVNFPRSWDECEAFFWWFDGMAFEEQSTPELLQKGHETAEAFIAQFCELWFPRYFHWFGRALLLTFIPANCRRRQRLGDPNPLLSGATKLLVKLFLDVSDELLPDPVDPPMLQLREELASGTVAGGSLYSVDKTVKAYRAQQDRMVALVFVSFFAVLPCVLYMSGRIG